MSSTMTASEIQRAHELYISEEFHNDPVDTYQRLVTTNGAASASRIWHLACQLYDRATEGG
jgi:hypothetical protein